MKRNEVDFSPISFQREFHFRMLQLNADDHLGKIENVQSILFVCGYYSISFIKYSLCLCYQVCFLKWDSDQGDTTPANKTTRLQYMAEKSNPWQI